MTVSGRSPGRGPAAVAILPDARPFSLIVQGALDSQRARPSDTLPAIARGFRIRLSTTPTPVRRSGTTAKRPISAIRLLATRC